MYLLFAVFVKTQISRAEIGDFGELKQRVVIRGSGPQASVYLYVSRERKATHGCST